MNFLKVAVLLLIPFVNSYCVQPDYDSGWFEMSSNNTNGKPSFLEIFHNLNTTELEVQLQVKPGSQENAGFIFDGMGFPQSDDDQDDYGGVSFAYNENNVRIWTPTRGLSVDAAAGTTGKACMVCTGVTGWNDVNKQLYQQAFVRVVIWVERYSKAGYDSDWFSVSESATNQAFFGDYNHGLSAVPSRVKTLIRVETGVNSGYIFKAAPQAMKDNRSLQGFGGVVVAYDNTKVRLWTPQVSTTGKLVFIGDGWGNENYSQFSGTTSARILAWSLERFPVDYTSTFTMTANNLALSYVTLNTNVHTGQVIVRYASSSGLIFESMGSTQGTDRKKPSSSLPYGGLVSGFNGTDVRVWAPYTAKNPVGNIVSLGVGWTNSPLAEVSVQVTVSARVCPMISSQCSVGFYPDSNWDCTACDCGFGALNQDCLTNGQCNCKPGFVDSKCLICAFDRYLKDGECIECLCGPGSTSSSCDNNGTCTCQSIHFTDVKCSVCTDGKYGSTCEDCSCDTSGSISNTCDNSGSCTCKAGFGGDKCSECSTSFFGESCQECGDCGNGVCDDGKSGSGNCVCDDGYVSVGNGFCNACQDGRYGPNCNLECSCGIGSNSNTCDSSGICSCKSHFEGEKCNTCADGFYVDDGECIACECGIGSENSTCTDGFCTCLDGFSGEKCEECEPFYYGDTCQNQCSSCENGECSDGTKGTGQCICDDGWATSQTNKCDICGPNRFGENCTACNNCGNGECTSGINGDGSCVCIEGWTTPSLGSPCSICDTSYVLISGQCRACHSSCQECSETSSGSCTQCPSGFSLEGGFCVNSCSNGKYKGSDGICQDCSSNCDSCVDGKTCIDCGKDYYLYQGSCVSQCPSNTYYTLTRCKDCDLDCETCNGPTNSSCTSCKSGLFEEGDYCVENCKSGYFRNFNTMKCEICQENCIECNQLDICTTCKPGILNFNGKCLETCPSGFYLSDATCEHCSSTCKTCSGGKINQCTSCKEGSNPFLSQGSCVGSCPSGQVVVNGVCQECSCNGFSSSCDLQGHCINCQGDREGKNCETCKSGFFMTESVCQACNCNGKADTCNSETGKCDSCRENTSGDHCESCAQGFIKSEDGTTCITSKDNQNSTTAIAAGSAVGAVAVIAIAGAAGYFILRNRKRTRFVVTPEMQQKVETYEVPTKKSGLPNEGPIALEIC